MKTLQLTEEKIKIIIRLLKHSNPNKDEQEVVFDLISWLEQTLKT